MGQNSPCAPAASAASAAGIARGCTSSGRWRNTKLTRCGWRRSSARTMGAASAVEGHS